MMIPKKGKVQFGKTAVNPLDQRRDLQKVRAEAMLTSGHI